MSRVQEAIAKVITRSNLTQEEARTAMEEIMTGQATDAQIAAFITGLRMKGETIAEIAGCAQAMRAQATQITTKHASLIDTCGTGGDGAHTFNISTTVAFVLAGAGLAVAKHGNRSVSSKSGSADVLEALGVNLALTPDQVGCCIDEIGIGFLFAQSLHGAMKYAAGPRKQLGVRTIFNILGPLTNPANADNQLLGVFSQELTETLGEVLARLGTKRAYVVHGHQGVDEVVLSGPSKITQLKDGSIKTFYLEPAQYGLPKAELTALVGGDALVNAGLTREVLQGAKGPRRNVILINAALGLIAGNLAGDIAEGMVLAAKSIDSGAALGKLEDLIKFTQSVA